MENTITVVNEKFYKVTYSDQAYATLCDEFDIPMQVRPGVRSQLEDIAAIWRMHQSQAESIRRPSDDAKELKAVEKRLKKLQEALDALSSSALIGLETTNLRYEMQSIVSEENYSDAGHEFYRYTDQDGNKVVLTDGVDDLIRSVSVLKKIANETIKNIKPIPAGSRSDHALNLWISNIAAIWTNQFERPFTRDTTKDGEPLTGAAQFCVAAFAHVSTTTTPNKILNGMKKHISKTRKEIYWQS